jgi:hypothetical protein
MEARSYRLVFAVGQLSTGAARPLQPNGLSVLTDVDGAGSGDAVLISDSAGSVSAVSMFIAAADAVAFKTNTVPVTISFTSASVLPAGRRIDIVLPANYFEGPANPAVSIVMVPSVVGAVMPTATCTLATAPQCVIACVTAGSIMEARSYRLVFAVGQLSTGAARPLQPNGLSVFTTVDSFGSGLSPALFTHSIVFENVADLFSQKRTLGAVNVSFFLSNPLPAGGRITIHLPNGFFTASPQPLASVISSGDPPAVTCTLSPSSIICTTSLRAIASGVIVLRFLPATLTTGIGMSATTNAFKIETSAEAASPAAVTPAIADAKVRNMPLSPHTLAVDSHVLAFCVIIFSVMNNVTHSLDAKCEYDNERG